MGDFSAARVVDRSTDGHREFISTVLGDPRYAANPTFRQKVPRLIKEYQTKEI